MVSRGVIAGIDVSRDWLDIHVCLRAPGQESGSDPCSKANRRFVTVAIANKTARTVWALLVKEEDYKAVPVI